MTRATNFNDHDSSSEAGLSYEVRAKQNRLSWNAASQAHQAHWENAADFFRSGGSTLFPEELDCLGSVDQMRIAHVLCGTGHDTISLARMGAEIVGVDLSDVAIDAARNLNRQLSAGAQFVNQDVFEWFQQEQQAARSSAAYEPFDVVYCSYGSINWLSDLALFARGASSVLKPTGRIVIVDFHPAAMVFNRRLERSFPYTSSGHAIRVEKGVGDYVAKSGSAIVPWGFKPGTYEFHNPYPCYTYRWGNSDMFDALTAHGFSIELFNEYGYCNGYKMFNDMEQDEPKRRWRLKAPNFPLMFGMAARRQ